MDGTRFDTLVRQLSIGQIGRRQFVVRSLGIGIGVAVTSRVARAQDDPTPEGGALQESDNDADQQAGVCPQPGDPWNWLCGTGPFGPWYPVLAPLDLTAETGIRWYGVDPQDRGALAAVAFTRAGQEVSRYQSRPDGAGQSWILSDATTQIEGALSVVVSDAGATTVVGEFNGVPFTGTVGPGGEVDLETPEVVPLDPVQERLLAQWQPVVRNLNGLLEIGQVTDDGPLQASNSGCFAAGFVVGFTWGGCLFGPAGCLPAAAAASYIANNCTSEW